MDQAQDRRRARGQRPRASDSTRVRRGARGQRPRASESTKDREHLPELDSLAGHEMTASFCPLAEAREFAPLAVYQAEEATVE